MGSGPYGTSDPQTTLRNKNKAYKSPDVSPIFNEKSTYKQYKFNDSTHVKSLDDKLYLWSLAFENKVYRIDLGKGVSGHIKTQERKS